MRYSQYLLPTLRENPSEAEVPSHQLMFRAGMIRKLAAGVYSHLPFGLRAIRKVENIIREEMNRAGAIETLLPFVQPAEVWQESHRWEDYAKDLGRLKDRHDRDFCLAPTDEEVITDIARKEVRSYRQMPINLYQIQTKFRDEIRPRFGVMRAREFIMKDAFSFDVDEEGLNVSYQKMVDAYTRIFTRCGFRFKVVEAESGLIGGNYSHEFMVLAETGEEIIVSCTRCSYAANIEKAEFKRPPKDSRVSAALKAETLQLASEEIVEEITHAPKGFAGPVGIAIPILADLDLRDMRNFVTGGNKKDFHLKGVNFGRDFKVTTFVDLRKFLPGDLCPLCGAETRTDKGIEVGHTFKLGTKYSKAMGATFVDAEGKERQFVMGCYGIGVERTVAAAIEQSYDENGIIFPMSITPFQALILPVNMKVTLLRDTAEHIYQDLLDQGVEVLYDDREETPGIKFKDADLIGIPLRVTLGEKNVKKGLLEIRKRKTGETLLVKKEDAASKIKEMIDQELRV
jgi:prolyl-tRNA synthetase